MVPGVIPARFLFPVALSLMLFACGEAKSPETETVGLRFEGQYDDARVTIDDIAVGSLTDVVARGVRVRSGPHRISVTASGHFPFDQLVDARPPITKVTVTLRKLPE